MRGCSPYPRHSRGLQSQSFSRNEIPLAIYVLQKAFEAMIEKRPEQDEVTHEDVT